MIEARGLSKRFGATVAVDDLSFVVRPGVITGFLGPNGAGKSTTMRMILGLDRPDSGTALVNGHPFTAAPRALREVGALLDARDAHRGRTAYHHLLALAQSNGIGKQRVLDVLDLVGLADAGGRRIGALSLGMTQRLGVAAALLGDPPVLVFDEPLNGLDPAGIVWMRELFRSLAGEGRTVLISSHLMNEMAVTADHLIVIGRGRLLSDSTTQDLTAGPSAKTIVRSPQLAKLATALEKAGASFAEADGYIEVEGMGCAQVGELAAKHRVVLHELFEEASSLEAAFMEMTKDSLEFEGRADAAVTSGRRRR